MNQVSPSKKWQAEASFNDQPWQRIKCEPVKPNKVFAAKRTKSNCLLRAEDRRVLTFLQRNTSAF